jgi:hypothetical protein
MDKRLGFALTAYFALWAVVAGGAMYGIVRAGYSVPVAVACAFLLFFFVNGSLAYRARSRQLTREGKEPPRYLQYLLLPQGLPKFNQEAPRSTHLIVGIAAALIGLFFVFCAFALAFDAEWSRISQRVLAAVICIILASMGVAFLYLAWRLLSFGSRSPVNIA